MPNDRIIKAIQKATSNEDSDNFQEIRYEGIGNDGISLIIETLTDNRNRTASEIRSILSKNGGNLGEKGSATFNFERIGKIKYNSNNISREEFFDISVENYATEVFEENNNIVAICLPDKLGRLRDALEEKFGEPLKSKLIWMAKNLIDIDDESKSKILTIIDLLEENEDVQYVYSNFNMNFENNELNEK